MTTHRARLLSLLASVVAVAACGGSPEDPDPSPRELTVALASPATGLAARGPLTIQVAVGGAPASVELLDGTRSLAVITAPWSYVWDTATVADGEHTLRAVAHQGAQTRSSDPVVVTLDNTGPRLVSTVPAAGATDVRLGTPIVATLDEALDPATVLPSSFRVRVGGADQPVAAVELSADGQTVTIEAGALPVGAAQVELLPLLTDALGNPVQPSTQWSWTAPVLIEMPTPGVGGEPIALTTDPAGSLLATTLSASACHFLRWTGTVWEAAYPPYTDTEISRQGFCSLRFAPDGTPYALYNVPDSGYPSHYALARWGGTAWTVLGRRDLFAGQTIRILFEATGAPMVMTAEYWRGNTMAVYRWKGNVWDTVPPPVSARGALTPKVQSRNDLGPLLLADVNLGGGNYSSSIFQWDGNAWSEWPAGPPGRGKALLLADEPIMIADQGGYVAFQLTDGAWTPLPGSVPSSGTAGDFLYLLRGRTGLVMISEFDNASWSIDRHDGSGWTRLQRAPADFASLQALATAGRDIYIAQDVWAQDQPVATKVYQLNQ
jgi:Bacterial Ig-like domain